MGKMVKALVRRSKFDRRVTMAVPLSVNRLRLLADKAKISIAEAEQDLAHPDGLKVKLGSWHIETMDIYAIRRFARQI